MRFNVFIIPALVAMTSAHPAEAPVEGDLFVRDEYRWCLGTDFHTPHKSDETWLTLSKGEKINSGTLCKFNWRMRGIDTDKVCAGDAFGGIKNCLGQEACAASGGGCKWPLYPESSVLKISRLTSDSLVNCGADAAGYVHGGINVGLGCSGDSIKRCIDQNLGISGNTDYVCNTTG
jgi:hypothetical protein